MYDPLLLLCADLLCAFTRRNVSAYEDPDFMGRETASYATKKLV